MNPRIQVEHTVTEEVTDVDLVVAQMRIAAGESLEDLGMKQDDIYVRGAALQCRITTEDPSNGFRPDTGQISVYRSAGGGGVRLDGGTVFVGAQVSPHFDSMLVKLTCRGRELPDGGAPGPASARRVPHPRRVDQHPLPRGGARRPGLPVAGRRRRASSTSVPSCSRRAWAATAAPSLLTYLADVSVNQPHGPATTHLKPRTKLPTLDTASPLPRGSRDLLREVGPAQFARQLRERTDVPVTDTTFRDAHQSLLATRVRTRDLLHVAGHVSRLTPELLSMEAWGGATYDVALRFLSEDPWERLALLREAMPNHPSADAAAGAQHRRLHALPRRRSPTRSSPRRPAPASTSSGSSTPSTTCRPDAPCDRCRARHRHGGRRGGLCYTGNLLDPGERLYTLDYYLRLAEQIVDTGAHVLAIKDMAGLLRAPAAATLVTGAA
jgi:pyruvate carboxylase